MKRWLCEAGSDKDGVSREAKLRLAMLPRHTVLAHLPELWREEERLCRLIRQSLNSVYLIYLLTFLPPAVAPGSEPILLVSFVVIVCSAVVLMEMLFRRVMAGRRLGMIYLLSQHQSVEMTPLLVEAWAMAEAWRSLLPGYNQQLRDALTHLFPKFVAADLPPLNRHQRFALGRYVQKAARRLRNPLAPLPDTEANFLRAILATLTPDLPGARARRRWFAVLEDLATERIAGEIESEPRTTVREAARGAIVRLFG